MARSTALRTCEDNLAKARSERDQLKTEVANLKARIADLETEEPTTPSTPPPTTPPPTTTALAHDPCTSPDPIPLWKGVYAQRTDNAEQVSTSMSALKPGRIEHNASGGPFNKPYRRLSVYRGEIMYSGPRSELGYNSRVPGQTFHAYPEGEHSRTEMWVRFDPTFPVTPYFVSVFDCKQGQPYSAVDQNNNGMLWVGAMSTWDAPGGPMRWQIISATTSFQPPLFIGPEAKRGAWTKVAIDVTWSKDPAKGRVQLRLDDQAYPLMTVKTLKHATSPVAGSTGVPALAVGDPVPGHLRVGPYIDPNILPAANLASTYIDYADIRVMAVS